MLVFWICAGVMLAAASALLLRPLLRGDPATRDRNAKLAALDAALAAGVISRGEYAAKRPASTDAAPRNDTRRTPLWMPFALGLALTIAAISLYRVVGEPRAIDPANHAGADASAPAMEEAVRGLEARLESNPDDLEGWLLLGRAYKTMQRFPEASATLAKALALAPDNPDAMVEYAEALALAAGDHRIVGEARKLLDRALAANPENQRGLWMLGIAELQAERYAEAIVVWERLLAQLPPDSEVADSVREQITQARERGGLPAPGGALAAAAPPPQTPPLPAGTANAELTNEVDIAPTANAELTNEVDIAPTAKAELNIEVDIAPELKSQVAAGDVLFVFARAPQGPKMPLAIQRLPATGFPLSITLDDSMGMMPALKLSQAEQVVVGARISKSGNAIPQSGDFEIISAPFAIKERTGPLKLVIRNIVP